VIPFDFITEWRARAPWIEDIQVEQDLVIARAITEIFGAEEAARNLAFRGGTALYKLHIAPAARYSEDIDLVQTAAGPIGGTLSAIRTVLDPWLGAPKRMRGEGRVTLMYRMASEGSPALPMRLKIEINSREHFSVLGYEERTLEVSSRWYSGSASVRTYALDELLGTKLRALYQRKRGRDLFDLWYAGERAKVNADRVVECLRRYLEHDGVRLSRAEFEANLHEKLADPTFGKDVEPLLAPAVLWNIEDAARYAFQELAPRLSGDPWKGLGGNRRRDNTNP
jgi:predicted nucleotidyltransferase component of viral defense system